MLFANKPLRGLSIIGISTPTPLCVEATLDRVLGRVYKTTLHDLDLGDLAVHRQLGIGHLARLLQQLLHRLGGTLQLLLVGNYEGYEALVSLNDERLGHIGRILRHIKMVRSNLR